MRFGGGVSILIAESGRWLSRKHKVVRLRVRRRYGECGGGCTVWPVINSRFALLILQVDKTRAVG